MTDAFSSIPIIDFKKLQKADTKDETLSQLREAIFRVGFLYLINHGLEVEYGQLQDNMIFGRLTWLFRT